MKDPRSLKMVEPWLEECHQCGHYAEGYPVPILYPKDGSLLTTRHLCLDCWKQASDNGRDRQKKHPEAYCD